VLAEQASEVQDATFLEDRVVNKKKLRAKWERNAKFNEEQKKKSAAAAMEMKFNRAWAEAGRRIAWAKNCSRWIA
jgi:hypothetical protein